MDKHAFFAEYKLSEDDLIEANITWDDLLRIEEAYRKQERSLREIGKSFIENAKNDLKFFHIETSFRDASASHLRLLTDLALQRSVYFFWELLLRKQ